MPSDLIRGWTPVRVKKTPQNKKLAPGSDSIRTDKALDAFYFGRNPHENKTLFFLSIRQQFAHIRQVVGDSADVLGSRDTVRYRDFQEQEIVPVQEIVERFGP